jgi:hypothetical protein
MYPGYSPADHVYGEAAADFGRSSSKTQVEGKLEMDPHIDGPGYRTGLHGAARKGPLGGLTAETGANATPLGARSTSKGGAETKDHTESKDGVETVKATTKTENGDGDSNPYFVIDTNPTPVNQILPERGAKAKQKDKKATEANGVNPDEAGVGLVAKKGKKEKKRKLEEISNTATTGPSTEQDENQAKKQKKKDKVKDDSDKPASAAPAEGKKAKKGKKGKKKKAKREADTETAAGDGGDNPGQPPKKNRKQRREGSKQGESS